MQQPSTARLDRLNFTHPPHPLSHPGARSASAWSHRSSHLAVRPGHCLLPRHAGAGGLCAAASKSLSSHEAISTKSTSQDAKLRVGKFYELEMSVRDCELDQYGVVNNVFYASYIEQAREEMVASLGISTSSIACTGNAMALTELSLKYLTPLKRGGKFVVKVRVAQIKGARIYIEQLIETLPDRKLVVEATATAVCLNREYRPTRVFPEVSSKLLHFFSSQEG